jgi:small subunit ribosomal protein S9
MAADDHDDETPPQEAAAEHAVPTEEATEIAGSAEDAPLEALQEAGEHAEIEPADEPEPFEPIAGNAVPTEEATEIAGSAEDAPLEAAQEAVEEEEEEVVAEAIAEEIESEVEAVAEAVAEEVVAEAIEAEVEEELVEALEGAVVEESIGPETGLEAEEDEALDEEPVPREKPAVPGAHLEVDIVPEGVDPLGRDTDPADMYASVAEAYDLDAESVDAGSETHEEEEEEEEILAKPISSAAIDLASGARYRATGKRKTAIARVTLRPGTGTYLVNGRLLEEHFPRVTLQRNIRQPLETVGYQERMDVVARLHGGGISAQAGALRHGVSRALLEADPNLRGELKRRGFLTRDSRAKERKKAGLKKARKRPQFSKR